MKSFNTISYFILVFLFIPVLSIGNNDSLLIKKIINAAIKQTKSIKSIAYNIETFSVAFGEIDTIKSSAYCIMDKREKDTLLGQKFHLFTEGSQIWYNDIVGFPTFILIDSSKTILFIHYGSDNFQEKITSKINEILKK